MKVQHAILKYGYSKQYIYDLIRSGKLSKDSDGTGVDEEGLAKHKQSRDVSKLRTAKQFEDLAIERKRLEEQTHKTEKESVSGDLLEDKPMDYLMRRERAGKIRDMELKHEKNLGKLLERSEVRKHYASFVGGTRRALESLEKSLAPKMYQILVEGISSQNKNIMGTVKEIINDECERILNEIDMGEDVLSKMNNAEEQDEDQDQEETPKPSDLPILLDEDDLEDEEQVQAERDEEEEEEDLEDYSDVAVEPLSVDNE